MLEPLSKYCSIHTVPKNNLNLCKKIPRRKCSSHSVSTLYTVPKNNLNLGLPLGLKTTPVSMLGPLSKYCTIHTVPKIIWISAQDYPDVYALITQ